MWREYVYVCEVCTRACFTGVTEAVHHLDVNQPFVWCQDSHKHCDP